MHDCEVCGAKVQETRRGRCWGCYNRWVDARPVGRGARCICCSERRARLLRTVELWGGWHPMCFNCSGQALGLNPLPPDLASLREVLSRDRRKRDRRWGKLDTRVFPYDRRVGERREDGRCDGVVDDAMIIEVTFDRPAAEDVDDMTRIRELVVL